MLEEKEAAVEGRARAVFQVSILSFLSIFTLLMLFFTTFSSAKKVNTLVQPAVLGCSECPPPSVCQNARCVLGKNAILSQTLELASGTILDCKGHKLTPLDTGVFDEPATKFKYLSDCDNESELDGCEFRPSAPEVAILINEASGVTVQNCVIGETGNTFDFGIVSVNVKNSPVQNQIVSNTITARMATIMLERVDKHLVQRNTLAYTSNNGHGIFIGGDADDNVIKQNTITSIGQGTVGWQRLFPGAQNFGGYVGEQDGGIWHIGEFPLINMVINGKLIQVRAPPTGLGTADRNILERNIISYKGDHTARYVGIGAFDQSPAGIQALVGTKDLIVRGNVVIGNFGINMGFAGFGHFSKEKSLLSGTCTLKEDRFCLTNADCSIPAVDGNQGWGICKGVTSWFGDRRVFNTLIEDNTFQGPFVPSKTATAVIGAIALDENVNPIIRSNRIIGSPDAPIPSGITLSYSSLESATVERNTISGAEHGLFLLSGAEGPVSGYPTGFDAAKFFGSRILLNDITGYTVAVLTDNEYNFKSELSVDDQGNICGPASIGCRGNYWGLPCPGFDQSKLVTENGLPERNVVDSHPYGESIARKRDTLLPETCQ